MYDIVHDKFNDAEKKECMNSFIEKVKSTRNGSRTAVFSSQFISGSRFISMRIKLICFFQTKKDG